MMFPVISDDDGDRIMILTARSRTVKYNTVGKLYDGNNDNGANKVMVIAITAFITNASHDKGILKF